MHPSRAVILIIEDDRDLRHSLRDVIELAGYDVITAADGREALAHISGRTTPLALILLDWVLPVMPAPAFLAGLALDPLHRDTPVLVLSGNNRIVSMELGVTAVLAKPTRARTLVDVIGRLAGAPANPDRRRAGGASESAADRATAASPERTARTMTLRRTDGRP
jgi:DNA-binding response OmpR family regulator